MRLMEEETMPRRLAHLTTIVALLTTLFAGLLVPPAVAQTSSATLNITFLACPPGGDWTGPPPGCAETVDAPETATVTASPDWVQPVHELQRNADGSYAVPVPVGGPVGLVNFFSQDFNAFTFDGVDTISRWYGEVNLAQGETRNVTVFYWNGPVDLIMPAENDLVVNVSTCGEGIDPTIDASACVPVTGDVPDLYVGTSPLRGIQMEDYLTREGGTFTYTGLPAYTQAQVVVHQPMAGYGDVFVTGQAEEIGEDSATAFLLRNELRVIDVYFHAPNGSSQTPAPTEAPEANAGTLRLMLLSCPEGVVPHDDPGQCTESMSDDGTAMVTMPESGEQVPLTSFARDTSGAYIITGVESSVTIGSISLRGRDRIASDADQIDGQAITYNVEPGQARDGRLYYFDQI
jgi:hypothetical protein